MCEYCKSNNIKNTNSVPIINTNRISIQEKRGLIDITHYDRERNIEHSFQTINYCPMCGRKLGE